MNYYTIGRTIYSNENPYINHRLDITRKHFQKILGIRYKIVEGPPPVGDVLYEGYLAYLRDSAGAGGPPRPATARAGAGGPPRPATAREGAGGPARESANEIAARRLQLGMLESRARRMGISPERLLELEMRAAVAAGAGAPADAVGNINIEEQRRLLAGFIPPPAARGRNVNLAALENIVVPELLSEEAVLERLNDQVLRRIRRNVRNANRQEAIRTVLELFPIENRTVTNTGEIMYKRDDLNIIADLINGLQFPIQLKDTFEIQQRVRELTGIESNLTAAEANDTNYCSPLPMVEGRECPMCLEDETAQNRLFKVHYTHDDDRIFCLNCIFRHMYGRLSTNITNDISCLVDTCDRHMTEYQLYRTIYFNQTPEKLRTIAPLKKTGTEILLRDAFLEVIAAKRQAVARDVAAKRELAQRERVLREEAERRNREAAERAAAEAARIAAAAEAAERERLERAQRRREQIALVERHRAANVSARALGTNTARGKFSDILNVGEILRAEQKEYGLCPYCLDTAYRGDGCIFMHHQRGGDSVDCPKGSIPSMLRRFPVNAGKPEWCIVCGRPSKGHKHYKLDGSGILSNVDHVYFDDREGRGSDRTCRLSGGGGTIEYFVRINALRDTLIDAYENGRLIWDNELKEQAVQRTLLYLGAGPGPGQTTYGWQSTQPQYQRAQRIIDTGRWDNVLPPPPEMPPNNNNVAAGAGAAADGAAGAAADAAADGAADASRILEFLSGLTVNYLLRPVAKLCSVRPGRGGTRRRYRLKKKISRKNKTRKNRKECGIHEDSAVATCLKRKPNL